MPVSNRITRLLWGCMVDFITLGRQEWSVTFKDGTEITI